MSETIPDPVKTESPQMPPAGHVSQIGCLDLRAAKTPEDLQHITGISQVGCVLIPQHLSAALYRIPMSKVGSVVPIPEGENISFQMGQIKLTGEALAGGDPEKILFILGQAFITTPVTSVGFKEIWVHGQFFAQRGSEGALGAKMTQVNGQTFYLPANARTFMGQDSLEGEFLELLPEPTALVIMGELTFEDSVTVELLKAKVLEIVLMGQIHAPPALLPILKVLTKEKMGEIKAKE